MMRRMKEECQARRQSRSFQPILNREASPDARLEARVSASTLHGGTPTTLIDTEQAQALSNQLGGANLAVAAPTIVGGASSAQPAVANSLGSLDPLQLGASPEGSGTTNQMYREYAYNISNIAALATIGDTGAVFGDSGASDSNNNQVGGLGGSGSFSGTSSVTVITPPPPPTNTSASSISVINSMNSYVEFLQTGKLIFEGNEITSSSNNVDIVPSLDRNVTGPSGSGPPVYNELVSITANFSPPTPTLGLGYNMQFSLVSSDFTASIDGAGNFDVVSPGGTLLYRSADFEQDGGSVGFEETINPAASTETVNWTDTLTLQVTGVKGVQVAGTGSFNFTYAVDEGGSSQVIHSGSTSHS